MMCANKSRKMHYYVWFMKPHICMVLCVCHRFPLQISTSQISTLTFSHRLMYIPLMHSMKTKWPILLPLKHNFTVLHWLSPQSTPECQSLCLALVSFNTQRALFSWHRWSWPWNWLYQTLSYSGAQSSVHSAQCTVHMWGNGLIQVGVSFQRGR